MESSHYIPRDGSPMRTTEMDLNLAPLWLQKNTDNPKKRTADAQANTFGCVAFERLLGQLYMCVEILLYSVILFTSNFTDHVLTAKYLYDKISGIFK